MDNHCFFKDPTVYSPIRMLITRTFPRKSLYQFRDDFFFLWQGASDQKSSRRVVEKKNIIRQAYQRQKEMYRQQGAVDGC